jgi:hypothetical protein
LRTEASPEVHASILCWIVRCQFEMQALVPNVFKSCASPPWFSGKPLELDLMLVPGYAEDPHSVSHTRTYFLPIDCPCIIGLWVEEKSFTTKLAHFLRLTSCLADWRAEELAPANEVEEPKGSEHERSKKRFWCSFLFAR